MLGMVKVLKQKGGLFRPFVLFVAFYLIIAGPAVAQNLSNTPGLLYPSLCICFIDKKIGWVAGHFGKIWHTEDGGKSWILQRSNTTKNIVDIYFTDKNNGWAVGYNGLILSTSDGGKSWIKQNSPLKYFWKTVYFKDKKHGWIAGEMGTVLGTDDGGRHWKVLITGDDVIFNSITFSPDGYGWVAGEFGVIYASTDSKKWFLQDNGVAAQDYTIWSICYIGNGKVMASGIASLLLFKPDINSKWISLNVLKRLNGEKSLFRILKFKDRLICIGQKDIYYSTEPTKRWNKAEMEGRLPYGEWLCDAWKNKDMIWVLGIKGSIYRSNDGIRWKRLK